MSQPFDASKSLATLEQDNTVIAVIEMSQSKWLVAAVVPGVNRQPLKKDRLRTVLQGLGEPRVKMPRLTSTPATARHAGPLPDSQPDLKIQVAGFGLGVW